MRLLYLAHDLDDAAIWRRAAMLRAGGAEVQVMGFRRRSGPLPGEAICLGRTADARMVQRAGAVLRALLTLGAALKDMPPPEAIIARNPEMLMLAARARQRWPEAALVYEVLDIHRMMLGDGPRPRAMRALERRLLRGASVILTSSPGFIREYFEPFGQTTAPIRLVENKCFFPGAALPPAQPGPRDGPLRIGWFGILRCAWTLDCLDRITRAEPGRYRIVLRGKPAADQLPDFAEVVAANPDMVFEGPYRAPEDLPAIYADVDLAFLIDRYDAGQNSDWLLPNRLYEGCRHGAVPVVLTGTEVARTLAARGLGVAVPAPQAEAVARVLGSLDRASIERMKAAVAAVPAAVWTTSQAECLDLVEALRRAAHPDTTELSPREAAE
ncbi:MAG: glycosyltransferase [Cereibacter changlensis]|uniref:Glycosyl transferase n=2 Tax=Cereibacter changlensis TaxID=402884 RepID=A0A2T4JQ79_9RHOB|nr:glycosyltransferase [Cereibacter changlensis]PTE20080.1 glycosyl transferase [Cereibacter changlensis JA139]PZX52885.1 succinoglycan biosynthesis protein ExoL [Cereibacter changlensis]